MGVDNMMKIINEYIPDAIKSIKISDLHGKTVAIDANLFIYRSVFAIRKGMGKDIENKIKGKVYKVTHIYIMFNRLLGFIKNNINAVFVFDSSYSYLKENIIKKRKELRKEIKIKYDNAITSEEKRRYYHVSEDITTKEYDDIINLIELFGFKYIIAPEESDSQCAYMISNGLVDYVISEDMDILLFGGKNIIKKFTISSNKKMKLIEAKPIIDHFHGDILSLIHLGILLGCDYAETVKGIGYRKAYRYIMDYKLIDKMIKNKIIGKDYRYIEAVKYFQKAKHIIIKKSDISRDSVQYDKLNTFIKNNGLDSSDTINKGLSVLKK